MARSCSSIGLGLLNRYPCMVLTPRSRSAAYWSTVSTPSAVVSMFRLRASATIGADDGDRLRVDLDVVHETLVDLDLVERNNLEISERGVAGAEIVQRKGHAEIVQPPQGVPGVLAVLQQCGFRDLELKTFERQSRFLRASTIVSTQSLASNCNAETLTATMMSSRHAQASRHARLSTHSPSAPIRPFASAIGMKTAGEIIPRSGWRHLTSASMQTTLRLMAQTIG